MNDLAWCSVCVKVTRHALYQGHTSDPVFECCQRCGNGIAVDATGIRS